MRVKSVNVEARQVEITGQPSKWGFEITVSVTLDNGQIINSKSAVTRGSDVPWDAEKRTSDQRETNIKGAIADVVKSICDQILSELGDA